VTSQSKAVSEPAWSSWTSSASPPPQLRALAQSDTAGLSDPSAFRILAACENPDHPTKPIVLVAPLFRAASYLERCPRHDLRSRIAGIFKPDAARATAEPAVRSPSLDTEGGTDVSQYLACTWPTYVAIVAPCFVRCNGTHGWCDW